MKTRSAQSRPQPAAHQIRFWMSTPAITISADAQFREALLLMHQRRSRRLPGCYGMRLSHSTQRLYGVVTAAE
jgi:CBS domain-containing protein